MRSTRFFAISAALLVTTSAPTVADDFDQLMALLAQRTHGQVSFVEVDHVALLDRPVRSSGELLYDRPDRLEKRTLAPKPASVLLLDDSVTIESGKRKRVLALHDYPQLAPFIESLRATLAGDRTALERNFQVTFAGGIERWTLTLVPLDAKIKALVQQIRIEGAHAELLEVNISQADGDSSVMTIGPSSSP